MKIVQILAHSNVKKLTNNFLKLLLFQVTSADSFENTILVGIVAKRSWLEFYLPGIQVEPPIPSRRSLVSRINICIFIAVDGGVFKTLFISGLCIFIDHDASEKSTFLLTG
ncbi:hypothetical protein NPIL_562931 [Nephila pilipes]|uniref:Uncharacterized protein n=1 Tax=Nephila pilipes TaxID=299642 RepID=A0A8X6UNE1_NEPPI|nr:hypothetical protein NPIL_562931 [Nephila pilipes]